MNPIHKHQAAILANITGSFTEKTPNIEVFNEANLLKYTDDLQKSLDTGRITTDVFEKGMKDLTKLQKKVITNSAGHQQTVYVRVHQDNTEHHFTHGDKVKFEHKGKSVVGEIKGLKHHDKFDPFGTALVHDAEGNKYSKSLRAIEHHGTPEAEHKVGDKVIVDGEKTGVITKIGTDMHSVKMDSGDEYGIMTNRITKPASESTETDKELKKIADRYKEVDGYGDGISHIQISKNIRSMFGCSQETIEAALKTHKVPKATAKHTADPKIGGITKKITTGTTTPTEPTKSVKGDKPLSPAKIKADDEVKVTADETWTGRDGKEISAGDQVYHAKEGDTYHATVVGPATSDPKKIILKKNSNSEKVIVGGAKALILMKKFKKGVESDMEKAFDLLMNGFEKG